MKLILTAILLTASLTTFAAQEFKTTAVLPSKSLLCNIELKYISGEGGSQTAVDVPKGLVTAKAVQKSNQGAKGNAGKEIQKALSLLDHLSTQDELACAAIRQRHLEARMNFGYIYAELTVKKSDKRPVVDNSCAIDYTVALDLLPVQSSHHPQAIGHIILSAKESIIVPCK